MSSVRHIAALMVTQAANRIARLRPKAAEEDSRPWESSDMVRMIEVWEAAETQATA